jgi:hypothetical protein
MVVAESSDESMRMRVLGFAKVIANLGMENGGGMKDGVRCDTLMQQADETSMLKSSMLGGQYRRKEKDPPGVSPCSVVARSVQS